MLLTPFDTIISALKANDLIPSVVTDTFAPTMLLDIKYPSKEVSQGNILKPEDAQEEPSVYFLAEPTDDSTYTLVMTDPDAPSRQDPKFGQWRHWVVPGLKPSSDLVEGSAPAVSKPKQAITPYVGPGPGPDTGIHRYLFLLFREPKDYELTLADVGGGNLREERRRWNAMEFAESKGLVPVAANLFLVHT